MTRNGLNEPVWVGWLDFLSLYFFLSLGARASYLFGYWLLLLLLLLACCLPFSPSSFLLLLS